MMKIVGGLLIIIGAILFYGAWSQVNERAFLLQVSLGPVFIYFGYQLL